MAAIAASKYRVESATDPRTETYIISAEKIPQIYGNLDSFFRTLPTEISINMLAENESISSIKYKNISFETLLDQTSTYRNVTGNIILKKRTQSVTIGTVNKISTPISFTLKDSAQGTSDFATQLQLILYLRGITLSDYCLSSVNLIYRGDM